ncbi:hypothetical protein JXK06_03210 [Patescibacteria group bacterium]|nr:hypothetical protein [Patescibacteria group bacterium]
MEKILELFRGLELFVVLLIFVSVFIFIVVKNINKKKRREEKLREREEATKVHIERILENSQNLSKFFADLELIPVEMLRSESLTDIIEKKFHIRNHDLYRFIKINDFINSLEAEKKELVFCLLVQALIKRPSYAIGSLIFRAIVENEIEVKDLLLNILKNSTDEFYSREACRSIIKYLLKYLRQNDNLSEFSKNKLLGEIKKTEYLIKQFYEP